MKNVWMMKLDPFGVQKYWKIKGEFMGRKFSELQNISKKELIKLYDEVANSQTDTGKLILEQIMYKENEEFKKHQKNHNWIITICTILIFILTIINTIYIIIK